MKNLIPIFKLNRSSNTQYFFENQPINQIDSAKDLGILFEPNLKLHSHIHNIVAKAKQRVSLIHRSFLSRDGVTLTRAFVVYVRPLLEYSGQFWSPSLITHINEIEKVQVKINCFAVEWSYRVILKHNIGIYSGRLKRLPCWQRRTFNFKLIMHFMPYYCNNWMISKWQNK